MPLSLQRAARAPGYQWVGHTIIHHTSPPTHPSKYLTSAHPRTHSPTHSPTHHHHHHQHHHNTTHDPRPIPLVTPRLGAQQVDFDREHAEREKRIDKLSRLLDVSQGDWSDRTRIIHHCTAAGRCNCTIRESTVQLIFDAASEAFLTVRPIIPAANKWTTLLPPVGWWMFACGCHGVVAKRMSSFVTS